MTLTCKCGVTNRIPSLPTTKIRCGNRSCQHEFTPLELAKATPEAPPKFELDIEDDFDPEEDEEW